MNWGFSEIPLERYPGPNFNHQHNRNTNPNTIPQTGGDRPLSCDLIIWPVRIDLTETGCCCGHSVCSVPVTVANASPNTSSSGNGQFGSRMTFRCLSGHKFADMMTEKTIECEASGWNETLTACDRKSSAKYIENTRYENTSEMCSRIDMHTPVAPHPGPSPSRRLTS